MKKILLIAILLFGFQSLQAQEYFLPVSTGSEVAKKAYQDAVLSTQHADFSSYQQLMMTALENDPEFFMVHAHRALSALGFNRPDIYKEHAPKALAVSEDKLNPAEKTIRKALVMLQKDPKADISGVIKELSVLYPNIPQAYDFGLYVAYFLNKNPQAAIDNSKMIVKLSPKLAGGYNMLGYSYMEVGDMKSAKSAFKKYIKFAKNEPNAYDSMGEYYMIMRDYKRSAKYYQKATDMGMESSKERAEEAKRLMAQ